MKALVPFVLIVALTGCGAPQTRMSTDVTTIPSKPPLGKYRTGFDPELAHRYGIPNFTVEFAVDGSYLAYGTTSKGEDRASGEWKRVGNRVLLVPESDQGELSDYLQQMRIEIDEYRNDVLVLKPKGGSIIGPGVLENPILQRTVSGD